MTTCCEMLSQDKKNMVMGDMVSQDQGNMAVGDMVSMGLGETEVVGNCMMSQDKKNLMVSQDKKNIVAGSWCPRIRRTRW